MALHQTTASNLVKSLVKHGLVKRSRNPDDRLDQRRLTLLREGLAALVTEMRRASPKAAGETLLGE